jgi:hypothetical protein
MARAFNLSISLRYIYCKSSFSVPRRCPRASRLRLLPTPNTTCIMCMQNFLTGAFWCLNFKCGGTCASGRNSIRQTFIITAAKLRRHLSRVSEREGVESNLGTEFSMKQKGRWNLCHSFARVCVCISSCCVCCGITRKRQLVAVCRQKINKRQVLRTAWQTARSRDHEWDAASYQSRIKLSQHDIWPG